MSAFRVAERPVLEAVNLNDKIKLEVSSFDVTDEYLCLGTTCSFVVAYKLDLHRKSCERLGYKYLALRKPVTHLLISPGTDSTSRRCTTICDGNLFIFKCDTLELVDYGAKLRGVLSMTLASFEGNSHACETKLSSSSKLKTQNSKHEPFQLCVALSKKSIKHYHMINDELISMCEIPLNDQPINLSMNSRFVCVALMSSFIMIDLALCQIQRLCDRDEDNFMPLVKTFDQNEFIVSGPGNLCLFISTTGTSERPPIRCKPGLLSVIHSYPHMICLYRTEVSIYSSLDQSIKQLIPFRSGLGLKMVNDVMLIGSSQAVYLLEPVPWEEQLDVLLEAGLIDDAISLSENWHESGGMSRQNFKHIQLRTRQRAAFMFLAQSNFERAMKLFLESEIDPRELISLYPNLLTGRLVFVRSLDPLHQLSSIEELTESNPDLQLAFNLFLFDYLTNLRESEQYLQETHYIYVDTALILLCLLLIKSNLYHETLIRLLTDQSINCEISVIDQNLEALQFHHARALFLHTQSVRLTLTSPELNTKDAIDLRGDARMLSIKAFKLWSDLESHQLKDEKFFGLDALMESYLTSKSMSTQMIIQSGHFLARLGRQDLAANLFIVGNIIENGPEGKNVRKLDEKLDYDSILKQLESWPEALRKYLEYMCKLDKRSGKLKSHASAHHTRLALLYIQQLNELMNNGRQPSDGTSNLSTNQKTKTSLAENVNRKDFDKQLYDELCESFQKFLEASSLYDYAEVDNVLEGKPRLLAHRTFVWGRLGRHEQALRTLVCDLHLYCHAETYCYVLGDGKATLRRELFEILLLICLERLAIEGNNHLPLMKSTVTSSTRTSSRKEMAVNGFNNNIDGNESLDSRALTNGNQSCPLMATTTQIRNSADIEKHMRDVIIDLINGNEQEFVPARVLQLITSGHGDTPTASSANHNYPLEVLPLSRLARFLHTAARRSRAVRRHTALALEVSRSTLLRATRDSYEVKSRHVVLHTYDNEDERRKCDLCGEPLSITRDGTRCAEQEEEAAEAAQRDHDDFALRLIPGELATDCPHSGNGKSDENGNGSSPRGRLLVAHLHCRSSASTSST